jgi:penicillin-binding protein 1A
MKSPTEPTGSGEGAAEGLTARQQAELRKAERDAYKEDARRARREKRDLRPRLKKLRVALLVAGLGLLAVVSWVFGVLMAVAQDLPDLEARAQYNRAENSVVFDRESQPLATLTGNERRILLESDEIGLPIKDAVVSIEDERFYEHRGIDYLGLARALREDILAGSAVQGGSTITQQFVKNALTAQEDRTVMQKLRESALAYQVERQWSKDKILTNYLNNIYFGEGAYGIEAAAKTFFGANHPGCGEAGDRCASQLRIEEAAMLAGIISSPSAYDPKTNPEAALERRNVVLAKMRELGRLEATDEEFAELTSISIPPASQVEPPKEESAAPYFTDWLRQQVVDKYGAGEAFGGGLKITSTLDLELQDAAQAAVQSRVGGLGPTAAVVVIENGTGKVRAMVGGENFNQSPFNLATNGLRQPGSSFKPFTLVTALANGVSPATVYQSAPQELPFVNTVKKKNGEVKEVNELFKVNNYEDSYLGSASVATATTYSDNSVYAQLGLDVGTEKIAEMAQDLGIQTRVPDNPAMILGGLKRGVTPLEMAYAYSTLANGGTQISGTMASRGNGRGPVAIEEVVADGDTVKDDLGASGKNEVVEKQVIDPAVAGSATEILHTVVTEGTGTRAQVGDDYIWGKTGTTDNNADAWFVGANEAVTVAVWVGYADGATPMLTEFGGAPVDGGTIPALIFNDVVSAYDELAAARDAAKEQPEDSEATTTTTTTAPTVEPAPAPVEAPPTEEPPAPAEPAAGAPAAPNAGGGGAVEGGAGPNG